MNSLSCPLEGLYGPVNDSDPATILSSCGEINRVNAKNGAVDFVSPQVKGILGYSQTEFVRLLEKDFTETLSGRKDGKRKDFVARCLEDPSPRIYAQTLSLTHKEGGSLWIKEKISPVYDQGEQIRFFIGSMEDVTEQKLLAEGLEEASEEKEILLKEGHHSVKNHLQMMSSLIDLAAGTLKDSEDFKALEPKRKKEMIKETEQLKPPRILLAEDNPVNQKMALRVLKKLGYGADVAANGLEVLQALERQPYDVVLMDVQMPDMDGLEAARKIKERWPQGPKIIAVTAYAIERDMDKCIGVGMDDYISKPIRIDELIKALAQCQLSSS